MLSPQSYSSEGPPPTHVIYTTPAQMHVNARLTLARKYQDLENRNT